ncbi:hypothetical protein [Propionispira arboris]|nr:hypothetical protein [Propionispira arboris]
MESEEQKSKQTICRDLGSGNNSNKARRGMMEKLKPCKCGNICIVRVCVYGYYVHCHKCGKETECYMTERQVSESWNRRADNAIK